MKLYVLLNVFNERTILSRCLSSVADAFFSHGKVEYIHPVFIDGRYPDYPGDDKFSTDGTAEYAQEAGTYLQVFDNECAKRTAGLRFIDTVAQDGDWVLYIDADETITEVFAWPERVGCFAFERASRKEIVYDRCRLYRWEPGLYFAGRHYKLHDAQGELVAGLGTAPDFQVVGHGVHYDLSHNRERMKDKRAYYKVLSAQEESVPA